MELQDVGCTVIFGQGPVTEFTASSWTHDLGARGTWVAPVEYRMLDDVIYVLPAKGGNGQAYELLGFAVMNANRLRGDVETEGCVLDRAAPARAAQTAAARSVPVLTWDDDRTGYQCPDGVQRLVLRCIGPDAGDGCQVLEWGLPGYGARKNSTANFRGALAEQLATCQPSKVTLDAEGRMTFPR